MSPSKPLRGLVLCHTGIPSASTVSALASSATSLGAVFSDELTPSVTHLICARAGSPEHRKVQQWNQERLGNLIPIIRPSWLVACSAAAARVDVDMHAMPPMAGLEVCCSGLETRVKAAVEKVCKRLGARYAKSLGLECTHLVCDKPEGKKWEFAKRETDMFIVTPEWIFACERLRGLAEEGLYLLKGGELDDEIGKSIVVGANVGECVDVPVSDVGKSISVGANAGEVVDNQSSKEEGEDEESITPSNEGVGLPVIRKRPSLKRPDHPSKLPSDDSDDKSIKLKLDVEEPEWMNMKPGLFLDPFTFYLTPSLAQDKSLHAPMRAKALQLLARGGGSLSEELTPRVHYIVIIRLPIAPSKLPEIEYAKKMGVSVVSLEWLENCIVQRRVLEDDNPALSDILPDENGLFMDSTTQTQHHADFKSSLFQGMRCALGPLALYDARTVRSVRQKLQRGRGKVLAHDGRGVVSSGVATHVVCGESLSAGAKRLVDLARESNQHVVVVTPEWIDACIQADKLVRINRCVLYTPVLHETPLRDMLRSRISVTITGHQERRCPLNCKRQVISKLARLLGAGYSERMTRGKTTHLIADSQSLEKSQKFGMAKRWGILTVNYQWLIACAQAGVVVDAADFQIKPESENEKRNSQGGEDEVEDVLGSNETQRKSTGASEESRKQTLKSPLTQRRSQRTKGRGEVGSLTQMEEGDKLFQRFTAGLLKSSAHAAPKDDTPPSPTVTRRRSTMSNSVSLELAEEGQKQWSLDASQSQVIMHRDLTPPPTPGNRSLRNMPPRAAKRRRTTPN